MIDSFDYYIMLVRVAQSVELGLQLLLYVAINVTAQESCEHSHRFIHEYIS